MKKELILSFVKFCIVGAVNTGISLAIYYILIGLGCSYLISMATGYIISSICGYVLNKIWVFKKKQDKISSSVFKYYILYASALLLNLCCMYIFVELLSISDIIAPLITIVITTIYNYFFSKFWVFKKSTKRPLFVTALKQDKAFRIIFTVFIFFVTAVLVNNIFNHPVADDFSNYNSIISAIGQETYSLPDVLKAVGSLGIKTYQTWQGTYFANFLFYLNPLLISIDAYKITMLLIQLFWLAGTWFMFNSVSVQSEESKIRILKTYCIFIISSILSMYSLGEGLYWFTGSILYIIPFTLSLIFFGCILRYLHSRHTKHLVSMFILAIILGGTSYVTGLVVGFVILMLTFYAFIKKTNYRAIFSGLLIVFCIGFALNVFCPGNFMRIDSFEKAPLIKVATYAVLNSLEMLKHLTFETLFIPISLIVIPIISPLIRKSNFKFEHPFIVSVLCLLCFTATFIPMAYSYGSGYQETRVKNIQLFYLSIMIIICIINYIGSLKTKTIYLKLENNNLILAGCLMAIVMVPAIGLENIQGFSLINDYLYTRNFQYDSCQDYLHAKLSSDAEVVEIENCKIYPTSLHHYIIVEDGWQTDAMEKYYHKSIIIKQ